MHNHKSPSKRIVRSLFTFTLLVSALWWSAQSFAESDPVPKPPVISNVTAEPKIFSKNDTVAFGLKIDQPAKVTVNVYDARGYLVRSMPSKKYLAAGEHKITWNGKAKRNKKLVPEAYYYTLSATNKQGQQSVYDLTDITGGERINAQNIEFDAKQEQVSYVLPSHARFFLRYGIDQGPMMGTLVNSAVQPFGKHTLPWDGRDQSGVFELTKLGEVKFGISGYALPRNALIYQADPLLLPTKATDWASVPVNKDIKRTVTPDTRASVHIHRFQNREASKDFAIILSAQSDTKTKAGELVANATTKFRVDIAPNDKAIVEAQRFEVSFFINNKLVHENEVSYVPYTWHLPKLDLAQGEHILTALVVGFGSHFGVASTKFVME